MKNIDLILKGPKVRVVIRNTCINKNKRRQKIQRHPRIKRCLLKPEMTIG
jgi:hypothetical protein